MDASKVLEVHQLATRFYTYDGVVKALEGVTFDIGQGETVGLVGETGCGKSVTALSVLRLIPSPPGKIEAGQVLFEMPAPDREALREAERKAWELIHANAKRLFPDGGASFFATPVPLDGANPLSLLPYEKIIDLANAVRRASLSADLRGALMRHLERVYEVRGKYDLLAKDEAYMRVVRGNFISMIFQEPMSALNPVINVGDQIAENILLHQREDLCNASLAWIRQELEKLGTPAVIPKFEKESLHVLCPACGTENYGRPAACVSCRTRFDYPSSGVPVTVPEGLVCPQCSSLSPHGTWGCEACGLVFRPDGGSPGSLTVSFRSRLRTGLRRARRPLSRVALGIYRALYERMAQDPNDFALSVASRIPFLRRYQRVMYNQAIRRAVGTLEEVRIPDPEKIVDSYPFELSGGMAQRVLIAIALSCNPKLLIADEPTTALDVTIQAQILKLIRELKSEFGSSVLLITHNLGVVAETCDRVGVMYAGSIIEMGPVRAIFKEPLHPYTKGLMESIPRVTVEKDRLEMIRGSVPNLIHPPAGCRFHPRCPVALDVCGWTASEVATRLVRPSEADGGGAYPGIDVEPVVLDDRTFLIQLEESGHEMALRDRASSKADLAFSAIESITKEGTVLTFRLKPQLAPTPVPHSAGHAVTCLLYGGGRNA